MLGKTNFPLFCSVAFAVVPDNAGTARGLFSGADKHKVFRFSDENVTARNGNKRKKREDDALTQGKPGNPAGHEQDKPKPDENFSGTNDRAFPGSRSGFHAGIVCAGR